ncbi:biotin--[acetyl-CoA-carboxylase] ligase [Stigmatella aurantiaca]|uniref:Bifunctional ligase/repressor BirA n=1 Tax=Stigmatella aurantiaca (strain DW4/3-1) TaxID=378806 RepID=Q09AZ9_STIAD|nr:biotin--[acetyl-CoA-carboxylase] ligase [Stigmatella aurantiaca]ADO72380.1 BirA bifunctional protein [Stigmatella aurantiaca DW4/3-1]EAU68887.1 biotin-[acetyl-CoA-carboxylase] ligase [Stigmatella aurantiaca DW4/3-1]
MPETPETQEELILGFLSEGGEDFTSGEALSSKLGLSRTAVWKHVEGLRSKGYRIEAIPARGYRLTEVPDRLTPLELNPLLATRDLGRTLHCHGTLASTNELAFRLAHEGAEHGEVVVAEQQTAGKGRRGRVWVSPPGLNLYFSAILRPELPPQHAPELTLVAAVALAETLREAGAEAAIKWPNDVQIDGRKVAGILTEMSAEPERVHFVVLGIGVNLNAQREHFPEELRAQATSLSLELGRPVPRASFAAALWLRLEEWLARHQEVGFGPVRRRWKELSCTLGQDVLVRTARLEFRGMAEDVDESGALLVRTPSGSIERVLAGDVEQVRPRVKGGA